jgi:HD superfamily phosphohydrolase YqeK
MRLHPLVRRAAEGELPPWTVAGPSRRRHMASVAALMERWAREIGLDGDAPIRWKAAGFLHDSLRDEEPRRMRALLPPALADLPDPLVHGPAAAVRLEEEGVQDGALLRAVAFHTTGHAELDRLGCFLYAADFLEPEREYLDEALERFRTRMAREPGPVLRRVAARRIGRQLEEGRPLRPETVGFWNRLIDEGESMVATDDEARNG